MNRDLITYNRTVMQRFALPRSDAKQLVKSKRNVANPNSAFYTQLRIWGQCHYDLRAAISINGVKPFKQPYQVYSPLSLLAPFPVLPQGFMVVGLPYPI